MVIYDHAVKYDLVCVTVCIYLVSPFKVVLYINQYVA